MRRYAAGARWYDVLSGEALVYGAGRRLGIDLLAPRPGDVVLDLGCGTGLNFASLVDAVGPTGLVVGVDRSPEMLAVARRRVARHRWANVRLVEADAATLDSERVRAVVAEHDPTHDGRVDALVATYALSVIRDRTEAWRRARAALRPGGRALVVDMHLPTGIARVFAPLALLACATGGADIRSHPWALLEADADPTTIRRGTARGGHLVAVAATLP